MLLFLYMQIDNQIGQQLQYFGVALTHRPQTLTQQIVRGVQVEESLSVLLLSNQHVVIAEHYGVYRPLLPFVQPNVLYLWCEKAHGYCFIKNLTA